MLILNGIFFNGFFGFGAIRNSACVTKINNIFKGQVLFKFLNNGKTAKTLI
jgi:hypothetical protein